LVEKQLATTIIGIFNRRLRDFIYQPCYAAAFLLDPLNFSLDDFDHRVLPINKLSDTELQDAIKCIEQLAVAAVGPAAQAHA
jgi:hypothetical protein